MGYLKIDNLVDVFCYVSAILVVVDFDTCTSNTGRVGDWVFAFSLKD